ncbi:amino acid ABC transporter permease [Thioclava marina]|jgi:L-glutamine ABC transporter membrane protein/L-glutamate ABC transporter membrane protein/L-aspartate ABC transporter membrane protein/L-asparagine ABC transporter membrane protein|uniref:Amino acid ABC transporter permease n=1 Tax=Thioclava marina TaxID=1915077 RepID=A0ABX3MPV1_9RHOB|nr:MULTISPECIES: amino acid ABC transporter permease [Thioclava]OOY13462.1 amino acid ABC transporter permease [Thioclava marina]OOY29177.1 amino acid ABC transporter permease [Thioclava sp. L04-15]TNE93776.1 MAG: amino acid ABC transporter permease [Paracoccaceae bacterium]
MSDTHAQTVAYVRDTMLDPKPAPANQSGAIQWLRENLFSGWLNTLLTVLGILAIYGFVSHFYGWFLHGVWNANSLAECRQIITDQYGQGATGACWGVIRDRWHQFIFGFYPPELYWRPILTFLLLFVAVGPVLFQWVPKKLIWFTPAYPFLAVWLLWGGSVWGPVLVALGFVLAYVVFNFVSRFGTIGGFAAGAIFAILFWLFGVSPLAEMLHAAIPLGIEPVESAKFGGFLLAITLGAGGIAMSLPLGVILALGRQSDMFLIRTFSVIFIEFIRGVPLITLLFVASLLLNYFLPPGTNFDIILRVMILVTMFAAAYIAEVIRGGLAALPRGQYEAADALGLDYWKAQRLIILPQALKISIPGIVSTFIGMFKDTTLVAFVGLFDPLKGIPDFIRADFAWKGIYWEPFIFVGAIFFILNFAMSRYSMYLENRLKRDHR